MDTKITLRKDVVRRYGKPSALPGWLALLWSAVEKLGDIDFLVSLLDRWPMISAFLDSWGWLLLMLGGFAWLGWMGRKNPVDATASGGVDLSTLGGVESESRLLSLETENRKPKQGVEQQGPLFYEDQEAMLADNWGIKKALEDPDVEKVCLAFASGHFYNGLLDAAVKQKVSHVTLALPGSKWLNDLYHGKEYRLGPATETIRTAWDKSPRNNVEVVLVECPGIHCVIAYKSDGGGWARAQLALTSEETDYWPSIVVDRIRQPELFQRIEDSFERQFSLGLGEWSADEDVLADEILVLKKFAPPGPPESILSSEERVLAFNELAKLFKIIQKAHGPGHKILLKLLGELAGDTPRTAHWDLARFVRVEVADQLSGI